MPYIAFIGPTGTTTEDAEYRTSYEHTTPSETTHTFASADIGAADATRLVVVAIHIVTATGVTIGGNAATLVGSGPAQFAYLLVAAGTTASIVVTVGSATASSAISVYRLVNLDSNTHHALATATTAASNVTTVNIATPNSGIVIGNYGAVSTADRTFTWSGLTENVDDDIGGASSYTTALAKDLAAGTTAVTVTASASTLTRRLTCLSFT